MSPTRTRSRVPARRPALPGRGYRRGYIAACIAVGLAAGLALACRTPPSAPPVPPRPDLAASLLKVAEQARETGDVATAEERFARALEADPTATAAHIGLGQIALAQGDLPSASAHFEQALGDQRSAVDARLGLAKVAARQGRRADARAQLEAVLAADSWCAEAHAELAALTGRAPRGAADPDEALRRAKDHPYDVAAGVAAANALASAGRKEEAARLLESLLWLGDLDPGATRRAWALLTRLDPRWREWQLVPVHSYADESIRAHPGWEFRLRLAWLGASRSLAPLLRVRFVPASVQGFGSNEGDGGGEGAPSSASLGAIGRALLAGHPHIPPSGVIAVFTEREPPRQARRERLGEADFLGRRLTVRLDPKPGPSRVLLHEVLHLYGGVHVAEDVPSLMNPSGESWKVDPLNARIAHLMRSRRFEGNLDSDVLHVVDLEAATRAYEDALRANLALRRAGLAEAMQLADTQPLEARRTALRVVELDPHLGDVARFTSLLLWRGDKPASAAFLLETASRLYGPRSARGRKAAADAERIWRQILPAGAGGR